MPDRYWVSGGNGSYNSTTNWSATSGGASGASVPTSVDNVFFNASSGSGTVTITPSSNCANLVLTGFTGTLSLTNNFLVNGTVLNLGTGGYTVSGANNLVLVTSMTATSNGTTFTGNLNIASNITLTLADNFTLTGNLIFSQTGTCTINGNTFNVGSNLTFTANGVVTGTTSFVYNGTGTWSHTGFTTNGVLRNNFTINTAGILTLGANVRYGTGILTYTAGTVVTTGSNLTILTSATLTTNGISWNDITSSGTTTITLGSNLTLTGTLNIVSAATLSFTLGGNTVVTTAASISNSGSFTVPSTLTFVNFTSSSGVFNGNTINITGNLSLSANGCTGSTNIVYTGTGTWTASGSSAIIQNPFTINTAGTLTLLGTVYKGGQTYTITAGTIIDTGATMVVGTSSSTTCNIASKTFEKLLVSGSITLTSNINAITFGTTGNNVINFILGGNSLNFTHLELGSVNTTTLPTAWVCQNIEFTSTSSAVINSNSITINGNILQSGTGGITGTTSIVYAGSGTWTQTGTVYFSNSFTINTSGTLTFNSGNLGGGIFTYTAGTVVVSPSSTLYIRTAGTTMNHGSIVWENVVLGNSLGSGSVTTLILNNKLICDTLTFGLSNTTFSGTDGTFDTYEMYLGSPLNSSQTITLVSTKTYLVRQNFECIQAPSTFPLTLKSTVAGSQAIFTLLAGSTINLGFLNATDINSSLGRTIYSYRGVFSNTLNWQLLPTDVTAVSSSNVFVN